MNTHHVRSAALSLAAATRALVLLGALASVIHAQTLQRTLLMTKDDPVIGAGDIRLKSVGVPCVAPSDNPFEREPLVTLKASLSNSRTAVGVYNPSQQAFQPLVTTTDPWIIDNSDGLGPQTARFRAFGDPWITDAPGGHHLFFMGSLAGGGTTTANNQALFGMPVSYDDMTGDLTPGALQMLQRLGSPLPDQDGELNPDYRLGKFVSLLSGPFTPLTAFTGILLPALPLAEITPVRPITESNDLGLWFEGRLVLREGTETAKVFPAEGGGPVTRRVKTFTALTAGAFGRGQGNALSLNACLSVHVLWSDGTAGVYSVTPTGDLQEIAKTGGLNAPGYPANPFAKLGNPSQSLYFGTAFKASVATGNGVAASSANGLFVSTRAFGPPFTPALAAFQGSSFWGAPHPDVTLSTFSDPLMNVSIGAYGSLLWTGTMRGTRAHPVASTQNAGLWAVVELDYAPGTYDEPVLLAREGFGYGGLLGTATLKTFTSAIFGTYCESNGDGPFAFESFLLQDGLQVTASNDKGVWGGIASLGPDQEVEYLREGVTVIDGKTVKAFKLFPKVSGSGAINRSLDISNRLLGHVTFTDLSTGVVLFTVEDWFLGSLYDPTP